MCKPHNASICLNSEALCAAPSGHLCDICRHHRQAYLWSCFIITMSTKVKERKIIYNYVFKLKGLGIQWSAYGTCLSCGQLEFDAWINEHIRYELPGSNEHIRSEQWPVWSRRKNK